MAIDQFPVTKLLALLVRQVSSPIARQIKEYAKNHDYFKRNVIMATAHLYNWWDLRAKMWILKLGRPVNIPVMSEKDAVNLGGDILGEAVVFFIGSCVLLAELNRQGNNDERKKQAQQEEWDAQMERLRQLRVELDQRAERIAYLAALLKQHQHPK